MIRKYDLRAKGKRMVRKYELRIKKVKYEDDRRMNEPFHSNPIKEGKISASGELRQHPCGNRKTQPGN